MVLQGFEGVLLPDWLGLEGVMASLALLSEGVMTVALLTAEVGHTAAQKLEQTGPEWDVRDNDDDDQDEDALHEAGVVASSLHQARLLLLLGHLQLAPEKIDDNHDDDIDDLHLDSLCSSLLLLPPPPPLPVHADLLLQHHFGL